MITRELAMNTLNGADYDDPVWCAIGPDLAETVVALYDENATILTNAERIAAGYAEERAALETRLRLAEASVSLLRADIDSTRAIASAQCVTAAEAMTERDHLALELRRLRAAEAPGTDDEAVAPWTWRSYPGQGYFWEHPTGPRVVRIWTGWSRSNAVGDDRSRFALDAMRAAAPGSV